MDAGKVDLRHGIVAPEVLPLRCRPPAGVGAAVRGVLPEEALRTYGHQLPGGLLLGEGRHLLDPRLQRVAAAGLGPRLAPDECG